MVYEFLTYHKRTYFQIDIGMFKIQIEMACTHKSQKNKRIQFDFECATTG